MADQWAADLAFRCPATTQGEWHSAAHRPTYEYEFDHAIPGQEAQGAVHSSDLPYVFGYFPKTGNIAGSFTEIDYKLAQLMETYWTNFAKMGNPNSSGVPPWPRFGDAQAYIRFTEEGQVEDAAGVRRRQCDVYPGIGGGAHETASISRAGRRASASGFRRWAGKVHAALPLMGRFGGRICGLTEASAEWNHPAIPRPAFPASSSSPASRLAKTQAADHATNFAAER